MTSHRIKIRFLIPSSKALRLIAFQILGSSESFLLKNLKKYVEKDDHDITFNSEVGVKNNKRRYSRKPLRIEARYQDKSGNVLKGIVRNISIGGVFVETSRPLERGEFIRVSLDVVDMGKVIDVTGKIVRYMADMGMGIEFTDQDNKEIRSLISTMRKLDQASLIALSRSAFEE